MLEHRLNPSPRLTAIVRKQLSEINSLMPQLVSLPCSRVISKDRLFRAILLSMPNERGGQIQKGVLLITFTETLRFFFHEIRLESLLKYFRIVLEPSWSGYCLPEILYWTRFKDPVLVMASERRDYQFISNLNSNLIPISIGASDWVDYRLFRPLQRERDYDVIYVANLTPIKRIHVLLRALREAEEKGALLRAVIVLSTWGGNVRAFEELLDFYRVRKQVTALINLKQAELNTWLSRARVSILLSRKEGSNRTLFESMFSNTPVLLLRENIGVNQEYINEHTGRLVYERDLADELIKFSQTEVNTFSPREWAMTHIAPELTTKKLEQVLIGSSNDDINVPLYVKVNSPEAVYMDPRIASLNPSIHEVLSHFRKESASVDVDVTAIFGKHSQ